jgi:hypothetical protein
MFYRASRPRIYRSGVFLRRAVAPWTILVAFGLAAPAAIGDESSRAQSFEDRLVYWLPAEMERSCTNYGDYLHRSGHAGTQGHAQGVAIAGDFAYVANREPGGLDVLSIATPGNPYLVGHLALPDAEAVVVAGTHAYLATTAGLRVIDVHDPSNPALLGILDLPAPAQRIALVRHDAGLGHVETFALVAAGDAGLCVVDVSRPADPRLVATLALPDPAGGVAAQAGYAFVATNFGLHVVDVRRPLDPRIVGAVAADSYYSDVAVQGNFAYPISGTRMDVVDISNPADPRRLGSVSALYLQSIAVQGRYAYLAGEYWGTTVVRIDDPAHPVIVGATDNFAGRALGVAVSRDRACVANSWAGLEVLDVGFPEDPIGMRFSDFIATGIAMTGDVACVVGRASSGIRTIDVSDPWNPSLLAFVSTPGVEPVDIKVSDSWGYVADLEGGFLVWDLLDPANPRFSAMVGLPNSAYEIALSGSYAVVADSTGGIFVIQIPEPVIVASLNTPGVEVGVTVEGSLAYVAAVDRLNVVDIADPLAPRLLASTPTPGFAQKVAIAGEHAFVADGPDGLTVVDVSDPFAPEVIATLDLGAYAAAVTVSDGVAFVAAGGLQVVDVSDPAAPRHRATVHIEIPKTIAVRDSDLYLADGARGFAFLPERGPQPGLR